MIELSRSLSLTFPNLEGEDVRWLQNQLCHRGYWLKRDGVFGPVTKRMLVTFQVSHGLSSDGVLKPIDVEALCRR